MGIMDNSYVSALRAFSESKPAAPAQASGPATAPSAISANQVPTAQEFEAAMLKHYQVTRQAVLDNAPADKKALVEKFFAEKDARYKQAIDEFSLQSPGTQAAVLNNPQMMADQMNKLSESVVGDVQSFVKSEGQKQEQRQKSEAAAKTEARENSGYAKAGSALGWGSLALAGVGIALTATGVGASVGIPLLGTVGAGAICGGAAAVVGAGAGLCKVKNNSDADGSNFEYGMGWLEVALNASVVGGAAAKGASLVTKSASATAQASEGFLAKIASYIPGLSKASLAEGQALAAVEKAEKVLGVATVEARQAAQATMTKLASGEVSAELIKNSAGKITGVTLTDAAGQVATDLTDDVGKLVGYGKIAFKESDALVGTSEAVKRNLKTGFYNTPLGDILTTRTNVPLQEGIMVKPMSTPSVSSQNPLFSSPSIKS